MLAVGHYSPPSCTKTGRSPRTCSGGDRRARPPPHHRPGSAISPRRPCVDRAPVPARNQATRRRPAGPCASSGTYTIPSPPPIFHAARVAALTQPAPRSFAQSHCDRRSGGRRRPRPCAYSSLANTPSTRAPPLAEDPAGNGIAHVPGPLRPDHRLPASSAPTLTRDRPREHMQTADSTCPADLPSTTSGQRFAVDRPTEYRHRLRFATGNCRTPEAYSECRVFPRGDVGTWWRQRLRVPRKNSRPADSCC
jgi:hypothetical protein